MQQIQSGFRENAEHFFNALDAEYVPADKPVAEEEAKEDHSEGEWGALGGLSVSMPPSVPPRQEVAPQALPTPVATPPSPFVKAQPFDDTSYAYLDRMHREGIDEIQRAIDNVSDEIIPGVHPKLLESYSQLLERRTSAVNAYQTFLATRRKTEIEERKMLIAEKKAGMGGTGGSKQEGIALSPKQLAEFVRELGDNRFSEVPEAEDAQIEDGKKIGYDRGFE